MSAFMSTRQLRPTSGSPGGIVVAEADAVMHAQLAHVAERHWRARWVLGVTR